MAFVLDCSAAISWCFEDESDAWSERLLDSLLATNAWVPSLWHLEVSNVLVQCERRGRLTEADSSAFLRRLSLLPIRSLEIPREEYFSSVILLARREKLSAYDAAYLHLCLREGVALASRDQALKDAAARAAVRVL